jgi:hypothetical protein
VQTEPPEEAGVRATVPIVRGVCELGAFDRLTGAGALHRGRVDQQQIVMKSGALAREDAHQPLQRVRQLAPAFEVPGLFGQAREQVRKPLARHGEKPPIRRDPHDRLRHAQRDDLRICDPSSGVVLPLGQEIVGRDEHGSEQQVEVGVHRGLQGRRCVLSTADFDPAAHKPSNTAPAAESII